MPRHTKPKSSTLALQQLRYAASRLNPRSTHAQRACRKLCVQATCRRIKIMLDKQLQVYELPTDRLLSTRVQHKCVYACCIVQHLQPLQCMVQLLLPLLAVPCNPCSWLVMLPCITAPSQLGLLLHFTCPTNPHFIFDSLNSTRLLTTGSYLTRCSL